MSANQKIAAISLLAVRHLHEVDILEESSDEEFILGRESHAKVINYFSNTIQLYSPEDFKSHFRMNRSDVEELCCNLDFQQQEGSGRPSLKPQEAILMTLWTLANQESFRGIADRFGLSKGNAYENFIKCCKTIAHLHTTYIVWPTAGELRKSTNNFNKLRGNNSFPNVIGCVDGTHIQIPGPIVDNSYYNRKGFHSMILQVICDSSHRFIDVFAGWPGSAHDARVWQNSPIYEKLRQGLLPEEFHLLGDSAYPLEIFIMVPFKDNGHLSARQRKYNKILSSSRVIIEQAIGRLKGVFRRLKYLDIKKLENFKYIVLSSCILHNFCIEKNCDFNANEVENNENIPEPAHNQDRLNGPAISKRNVIMNSL